MVEGCACVAPGTAAELPTHLLLPARGVLVLSPSQFPQLTVQSALSAVGCTWPLEAASTDHADNQWVMLKTDTWQIL